MTILYRWGRSRLGPAATCISNMSQVAKINVYIDARKIVGNPLLLEVYEILKIIRPGWRAESIEPKNFTDGITNLLMGYYEKGKFDEDVILLRIYGEGTEMMIDRNLEKKNILVLSEAGCCPPLYAEFNNGIAYGFVHGQTLEPDTVRDDRIKRLIAEEMCRMHYVKPEGMEPKPELFSKLQKFLNIYPDHLDTPEKQKRFVELLPSKDKILEDFGLLKSQLETLNCEIVFSHNDLLLKNIIYSKEKDKITFIDHEYAMFNYQPHDIANHFCEYAGVDDVDFSRYPGKEYQLDWIRHYLVCWEEINGRPGSGVTDRDVEEMYIKVNKFALASHFFWASWSIIQAKYSKINFDFLGLPSIMNQCKWLMIGSTIPCNKSCRSEFCGYHLQSVRRGSLGLLPCLRCGVGVRGKSELCLRCGGKRYRELKRYYDKRNGKLTDKIIKAPQDYINRFPIKTNNELDKDIII